MKLKKTASIIVLFCFVLCSCSKSKDAAKYGIRDAVLNDDNAKAQSFSITMSKEQIIGAAVITGIAVLAIGYGFFYLIRKNNSLKMAGESLTQDKANLTAANEGLTQEKAALVEENTNLRTTGECLSEDNALLKVIVDGLTETNVSLKADYKEMMKDREMKTQGIIKEYTDSLEKAKEFSRKTEQIIDRVFNDSLTDDDAGEINRLRFLFLSHFNKREVAQLEDDIFKISEEAEFADFDLLF